MSERKWTDAQKTAITDRSGAVVVSAAAGSGKTSVLVERALRMICDEGVPADSLLIMTFTNAAAAELRGRLAKGIAERIRQNPKNTGLRRQRLLIQRAPIGTVDSYCKHLVQENFTLLGLPPEIETITEAELAELEEAALAQTLEEAYQNPDFAAFSSMYGRARSDRETGNVILGLYRWLQSEPDPSRKLEELTTLYETAQPLEDTAVGKLLLQEVIDGIRLAQGLVGRARELVQRDQALAAYDTALQVGEQLARQLMESAAVADWDELKHKLDTLVFPTLKGVRNYEGDLQETVKKAWSEAKDVLKGLGGLMPCTQAEYAEDCGRALPLVRAITHACRRFTEILWEKKLEEKTLYFSDFEHLALQLLKEKTGEKTPLAQELSQRYTAVMVDEYQDTNPLQESLYRQLAREKGENLFYVGDVKQSIYRFRMARPELFIEKIREAQGEKEPHPLLVRLDENFRSLDGVIDGVNDTFSKLMTEKLGDVAYTQKEALRRGSEEQTGGSTMLALTEKDESGTDAAWVATLVQKLVREQYSVRDGDGRRPVRYDDICILLRSMKGKSKAYQEAFKKRGIPLYVGGQGDFLSATEVQPLLAALKVIDNPAVDIPMAAALLSPMFGFTPDDLTDLRCLQPQGSIYSALLKSEEEKAKSFLALLSRMRVLAVQRTVRELCDILLRETNYDAVLGAMQGGTARRENLRGFLRFASGYTGKEGLSGFLRMADHAVEIGVKGAGAAQAPAGMVRMMSVHGSKGLEFPVCILADLAKPFNLMDTKSPVLFHHELGIGLKLRDVGGLYVTAPYKAVGKKLEQESKSEEMRVLYVAMTRAKDALFLSLGAKDAAGMANKMQFWLAASPLNDGLLRRMNSQGEWVLASWLSGEDRDASVEEILQVPQNQGGCKLLRLETESPQQAEQEGVQADQKLLAALKKSFQREENISKPEESQLKVSVSQLAHKEFQHVLRRPSFLYEKKLSATERGTATHLFMQVADFGKAKTNLEEEIRRLVTMEYLEAAVADQLDRESLQSFFGSALCERMCGAKLLREYDFITKVPSLVYADGDSKGEELYVQGIADCVLLLDGKAELVDYKTDRGKTAEELREMYQKQLEIYRYALEKKLGVPITKGVLYSFDRNEEIVVFDEN